MVDPSADERAREPHSAEAQDPPWDDLTEDGYEAIVAELRELRPLRPLRWAFVAMRGIVNGDVLRDVG